MSNKAGVWIDHNQAIVILITDEGHEIKKLKSGVEKPALGSKRQKNEYTPNDFVPEDRRERKLVDERKKMYDGVLACIKGAASLVILGPGEAKSEFSKHIKTKKVRGLTVELETTDKMTDRQIAAKVKTHFAKAPGSKAVAPNKAVAVKKPIAPKKTAKKKACKVVVGKRTKKT